MFDMRALAFSLAVLVPSAVVAQISAPDLVFPENGGWRWVDDVHSWTEVPTAVQYRMQIDTLGGDFSKAIVDALVADNFWFGTLWPGFYRWRVAASDGEAWSVWSDVWTFESRFPLSTEPEAETQAPIALERVFPNPSRGQVAIQFSVLDREADLRVYDTLGREVALLYQGHGAHPRRVRWEPTGLPAGVYVLVLRSSTGYVAERVVLVD